MDWLLADNQAQDSAGAFSRIPLPDLCVPSRGKTTVVLVTVGLVMVLLPTLPHLDDGHVQCWQRLFGFLTNRYLPTRWHPYGKKCAEFSRADILTTQRGNEGQKPARVTAPARLRDEQKAALRRASKFHYLSSRFPFGTVSPAGLCWIFLVSSVVTEEAKKTHKKACQCRSTTCPPPHRSIQMGGLGPGGTGGDGTVRKEIPHARKHSETRELSVSGGHLSFITSLSALCPAR
jgi:hypothetical protein